MLNDIILASVQVCGALIVMLGLAGLVSYTIATLPTEDDD